MTAIVTSGMDESFLSSEQIEIKKTCDDMDRLRDEILKQSETEPAFKAERRALIAKSLDEQKEREKQQRQASNEAGRYTIVEASRFIADNSSAIAESIRSKLEQSANRGELTFYQPHSLEVYDKRTAVLGWYEEVYWDDLNVWLKDNEPRISYLFPKPESSKTKN